MEGAAVEIVMVFADGVDVTAGFKVVVEGTTASVVLRVSYEVGREDGEAASEPWVDNGDGSVTLNVEVVPGLYHAADSAAMLEALKRPDAADSAATLEALKRPDAAEPAKAGDAVVVPRQTGEQGYYKVWVSDALIKAE